MNIIKDTPFEFGYQMWQARPPQPSLMVLVKGTFTIVPGGVCTPAPVQATTHGEVYYDDDPANSVRYDTDFAITKKRGECFLVGTCHPPGGSAATSAVAFRVGAAKKALAVFGDRHWTRGLVVGATSKPEPFTSMPLRWERSFGGPGFDKNPVGRGIATTNTPQGNIVRLPNIEDPHNLIRDPGTKPDPAGAFPILGTWKSRASKLGTTDQNWVDTRWPWFPVDFDWGFFNAAPPDQQINGYRRADEEIAGQNLHPEFGTFRAQLPGVRARAFLEMRSGDQVRFSEVPLNLDTITLDTDAMQVICQWRGLVEVPSEDLHEVETLFYVHEPLAAGTDLAGCRAWLDRKRAEAADEDAGFAPEGPADEAAAEPPEPPPAPGPDPTAELVKELEAAAAAAAKKGGPGAQLEALLMADLAAGAKASAEPEPPEPPPIKPSALRAAMRADGVPVPAELEAIPDPPDELPEEPAAEEPTPDEPAGLGREEIYARYQRGEGFDGEDLTGADLRGLDLSKANFAGALLAGANFTQCNLDEATFEGANLQQADLSESSMVATSFKEAELGSAKAYRCNADRAVFDHALAQESAWSGTRFERASFESADFSHGVLEGCNFQDASAPAGDFTQAKMDGSDFRRARLVDARFEGTQAKHSQFDDADLTKLRASESADLSESSMRGVTAPNSKWDSSALNNVNFSMANLAGADFAAAGLVQANFTSCLLRGAKFQGASLVGATMLKADAMESNFEGADLSHADLRGSNFFSAQFFRAKVNFAQLELANVNRTHLANPKRR